MNSLRKISDGSLDDIVLPNVFDEWSQIDVKEELIEEFESSNYHVEIMVTIFFSFPRFF